jgi:hypothetical protein
LDCDLCEGCRFKNASSADGTLYGGLRRWQAWESSGYVYIMLRVLRMWSSLSCMLLFPILNGNSRKLVAIAVGAASCRVWEMWVALPFRYHGGTGNSEAKAERSLHDLEDTMPILQTRKLNQLCKDDSDTRSVLAIDSQTFLFQSREQLQYCSTIS